MHVPAQLGLLPRITGVLPGRALGRGRRGERAGDADDGGERDDRAGWWGDAAIYRERAQQQPGDQSDQQRGDDRRLGHRGEPLLELPQVGNGHGLLNGLDAAQADVAHDCVRLVGCHRGRLGAVER